MCLDNTETSYSYIHPVLTTKEDNIKTTDDIKTTILNTLDMTPEQYQNELLNRINHFISDLNEDFKNKDYTSNYIWYISLIENYISELEKLWDINTTKLNEKLNQIKTNQSIAEEKQKDKNKSNKQNQTEQVNNSDPFSKFYTTIEY